MVFRPLRFFEQQTARKLGGIVGIFGQRIKRRVLFIFIRLVELFFVVGFVGFVGFVRDKLVIDFESRLKSGHFRRS